jgi:hypothetical protein
MCELWTWDICVCMSDVRIEGLGYMCEYLMCKLKGWDIFVCMFDVLIEGLGYMCVYV